MSAVAHAGSEFMLRISSVRELPQVAGQPNTGDENRHWVPVIREWENVTFDLGLRRPATPRPRLTLPAAGAWIAISF